RDFHVTGVQTCALPILASRRPSATIWSAGKPVIAATRSAREFWNSLRNALPRSQACPPTRLLRSDDGSPPHDRRPSVQQWVFSDIGRASCRARVWYEQL